MIDAVLTFTISLDPAAFMALLIVSALLCLISLPVGFYFIRHGRIMQDTPTSKIRSASQGFVELEGQARSIDDKPLSAPGTRTDCVWYDFKAEEHQDKSWFDTGNRKDKWITVSADRSPFRFYIDDGTRVALNQLKKDRNELLRKFDTNGDGEIDLDEWNIARSAARIQAEKEVDDDYEPTQHHVLVKPFNRKNPYIVSCFGEDELTSRYRLYSVGSFVTFLTTGVYSILMIIIRWGI